MSRRCFGIVIDRSLRIQADQVGGLDPEVGWPARSENETNVDATLNTIFFNNILVV